MDAAGPAGAGEPLERRFISGGSQNEIYELRRGDLHGALRIPPPTAPADRDDGHPARVADHRGARRHRRAPHRGHRRLHRPVGARPHLLPDGLRRRLVADGPDGGPWPAPFDTDLEARAGPGLRARRGHRPAVEGRLAGQGPRGPRRPDGFHERQVDRWTAFLERIKGRELPGFDEAVGLAARPQADRLHPRAHARRLPVRQRDVPPRRPGPAGRHRRLGDGHRRRPEARPRPGWCRPGPRTRRSGDGERRRATST